MTRAVGARAPWIGSVLLILAWANTAWSQSEMAGTHPADSGPPYLALAICAAIFGAAGFWAGRRDKPATPTAEPRESEPESAFGVLATTIAERSPDLAMTPAALPGAKPGRPTEAQTSLTWGRLRHADRLASVGKMASSVAHEIGTPLMVISGNAQLILMDPDDSEEVVVLTQTIAEQASRLQQIIESLLSYTRQRRPAVHLSELTVGELVDSAANLLEFEADEVGVTIETSGPSELTGHLDRGKMLQLITNIGINAVHASEEGASVLIEWSRVEHSGEECLVIRVRDAGVGMSEEQIARIAEPFYTTKSEGEGTGLGMAICAQILDELGGDLEVASTPGEGTVVAIRVPLRPDLALAPSGSTEIEGQSPGEDDGSSS